MLGLIQDAQLMLSKTLKHAADYFPNTEVVSIGSDGETRLGYIQIDQRARQLASALATIGISSGQLAGSLAFSTHRHLEVFHAVPGIGATLHTANPRHSIEQLAYAMNLAGYSKLFIEPETIEIAEQLVELVPLLDTIIVMTSADCMPNSSLTGIICYEDLIERGDCSFAWPEFDERTGSTLCFTSGTTGPPKGCLYSHRGTLLNVMSVATNAGWGLSAGDAVLAMSPFYHCNGWGLPYLAPMMGTKLVLPGRDLSASALQNLIVKEDVLIAAGVPTLWRAIVDHCRKNDVGLGKFETAFCGGAAADPIVVQDLLEDFGVRTVHAWGMTETTHASILSVPPNKPALDEALKLSAVQGRPVFGSTMRIVDEDGKALPWDGKSGGLLQVKGPWMASGYFRQPNLTAPFQDDWMDTGDIAVVMPDRNLRITDRSKDVIKSGGEWISSVTLENAVINLPGIEAAAAIAAAHPKWTERPLLVAVRCEASEISEDAVLAHMALTLPKWWLPDRVIFVEELPYSHAGKLLKAALRDQFGGIYEN